MGLSLKDLLARSASTKMTSAPSRTQLAVAIWDDEACEHIVYKVQDLKVDEEKRAIVFLLDEPGKHPGWMEPLDA
jgi:hypothetical protein